LKITLFLLIAIFSLQNTVLHAQEPGEIASNHTPKAKIMDTFPGPVGWTGVVIGSADGTKVLLWETPEGLTVFGNVLDKNGRNLTELAAKKHGASPTTVKLAVSVDASLAEMQSSNSDNSSQELGLFLKTVERAKTASLTQGTGSKALYIYYDYNCSFCHDLYKDLQHHADKLDITAYWLPVAIIGKTSLLMGAVMLNGEITLDDMVYNLKKIPEQVVDQVLVDEVQKNTELLRSLGIGAVATPTLLHMNVDGKINSFAGRPSLAQLKNIVGDVKSDTVQIIERSGSKEDSRK